MSIDNVVPGVAVVALGVLMQLTSDLMLTLVAPHLRPLVVLRNRSRPSCAPAQSALTVGPVLCLLTEV